MLTKVDIKAEQSPVGSQRSEISSTDPNLPLKDTQLISLFKEKRPHTVRSQVFLHFDRLQLTPPIRLRDFTNYIQSGEETAYKKA